MHYKYDPAAIRAALPAHRRHEFDAAYLGALAAAGRTFSLEQLHSVVGEWARTLPSGPARPQDAI